MANILDYNKAIDAYQGNKNAITYNNALNVANTLRGQSNQPTNNQPAFSGGSGNQQQNNAGGNSGGGGGSTLESVPSAPAFDEGPYNEILSGIEQLGSSFKSSLETEQQGITQRGKEQLTSLENEKKTGDENLQTYKTKAESDEAYNVNEQRRQTYEIQQGLAARYGTTTGNLGFVGGLAGDSASRNIARIRGLAQQEYGKVATLQNQLLREYISNKTSIENQVSQLIKESRDKLSSSLAELQIQRGQTLAAKAERKQNLYQQYQSEVNQINARNTAYIQQLELATKKIQNTLASKSYEVQYTEQDAIDNEIARIQSQYPTAEVNYSRGSATKGGALNFSIPGQEDSEDDDEPSLDDFKPR